MIGYGDRARTQCEVVRLFRETHPDLPPLNQGTISKIEAQYREMGHVRKVPSKRQAVVDDDTKLNLLLALEENPITPARQLARDMCDRARLMIGLNEFEFGVTGTTKADNSFRVRAFESHYSRVLCVCVLSTREPAVPTLQGRPPTIYFQRSGEREQLIGRIGRRADVVADVLSCRRHGEKKTQTERPTSWSSELRVRKVSPDTVLFRLVATRSQCSGSSISSVSEKMLKTYSLVTKIDKQANVFTSRIDLFKDFSNPRSIKLSHLPVYIQIGHVNQKSGSPTTPHAGAGRVMSRECQGASRQAFRRGRGEPPSSKDGPMWTGCGGHVVLAASVKYVVYYSATASKSTLQRLVAKFETTGSVNNLPTPVRQRNARSAENIAAVRVNVQENPMHRHLKRLLKIISVTADNVWEREGNPLHILCLCLALAGVRATYLDSRCPDLEPSEIQRASLSRILSLVSWADLYKDL
ncbi:hypothetical protein NQ318_006261 [Aromia moschata]|uniref:DUF4817 domain-containing protein n=1 Tax=Aromia moschata TaxID=1265417 RepID=A0AAV8YWE2_9CUCU|nr:hypothetical protein NQ318_006261 [Aromia moschata]